MLVVSQRPEGRARCDGHTIDQFAAFVAHALSGVVLRDCAMGREHMSVMKNVSLRGRGLNGASSSSVPRPPIPAKICAGSLNAGHNRQKSAYFLKSARSKHS